MSSADQSQAEAEPPAPWPDEAPDPEGALLGARRRGGGVDVGEVVGRRQGGQGGHHLRGGGRQRHGPAPRRPPGGRCGAGRRSTEWPPDGHRRGTGHAAVGEPRPASTGTGSRARRSHPGPRRRGPPRRRQVDVVGSGEQVAVDGRCASSASWVALGHHLAGVEHARCGRARRSVERRWAMRMVVRPAISSREGAVDRLLGGGVDRRRGVVEHEDRGGRSEIARARASRWRWPPREGHPRSPTTVS